MQTFAQKQSRPQKQSSSGFGRPEPSLEPDHRQYPQLLPTHTLGNRPAETARQTHAGEPKAGAAAPGPRFSFGRIPIHPPAAGAIPAKVAINQPGDAEEQEADRVSEEVVRMPEPQLARPCTCGGTCADCRQEGAGQTPRRLRMKSLAGSAPAQTAPPMVQAVLRSPGRPLDAAARAFMEPRFGHDFSRVRVHAGAAAAQSAREVNARAYAVGRDIVFGAGEYQPSTSQGRSLLAHELAHVRQDAQAGYPGGRLRRQPSSSAPPSGGHVEYPSPDEKDLIQFALDRNLNLDDLLRANPQFANSRPLSPLVGVFIPEAYHASTTAHDPNAPASRNATWAQIHSADAALDITWIEQLPEALKTSIDLAYADSKAEKALKTAEKGDARLKQIDKEMEKRKKDLQTGTVARLSKTDPSIARKHGKQLDQLLEADAAFAHAKEEIENDGARRKEERKVELRSAADRSVAAGTRADTVARPPTPTITREEGKTSARNDFMSWAIGILGSTAAAKRHFESVRAVARQPGMLLTAAAATRFEAARDDFEKSHPGYTFPSTDGALGLRGFHQARTGVGKLGHALGIAFDLLAYDNPNQKIGDDSHAYLLRRFGGVGDQRGRSMMNIGGKAGEDTVAQLGRDTMAKRPNKEGDATVATIRDQFEEMAATSERFQASMAPQLPELSAARDEYFNSMELEKELAQAARDEKNADKIADAARRAEIKEPLTAKKEQLQQALDTARADVDAGLAHAFAAWSATIGADIAETRARPARTTQDLDAIDADAPDALAVLSDFAKQHQLQKPKPKQSAAGYKPGLQKELAAREKSRNPNDLLSGTYIDNEIAVLTATQRRIHDPKAVFGEGKVVPDPSQATPGAAATGSGPAPPKHWATKPDVVNVPVMQLIERGFVRHDDMPARSPGGARQEVFNVEVVTTLARFGFSPGATFGDTMHFDFIEGYSAVPGGRSWVNIDKTRYGPSGDLPKKR
jgi:hypothetical protein